MPDESGLTHLRPDGSAHMVDVGGKDVTERKAIATARIAMSAEAARAIRDGNLKKGDALGAARLAGIMAAKKASDLIPLCHPLPLTKVEIDIESTENGFAISALVKTRGQTGVEMEALTAASVAALTLYDMAKALDKAMVIGPVQLEQKSGGKSGDFQRVSGK
ncbi:cyclic pyranopterin monophosphate synthase MoaC [Cucumibacter marinus]|uniref:cyclic pyranopterin monophosphate synthase MoaC n=1 Tax=Cucumibacter marinus TaxID=1121252 RepID=UPI00055A61E7|nr:cyclic pyranopterin monophosphate synthase MoaC [Cucumibacter marinus]